MNPIKQKIINNIRLNDIWNLCYANKKLEAYAVKIFSQTPTYQIILFTKEKLHSVTQ